MIDTQLSSSVEKVGLDKGLDEKILQTLKLNIEVIQRHQERILDTLRSSKSNTIPVVGSCTINNGGILSLAQCEKFVSSDLSDLQQRRLRENYNWWTKNHLVSCFPAAGAASRFLGTMESFVTEMDCKIPELDRCYKMSEKLDLKLLRQKLEDVSTLDLPFKSPLLIRNFRKSAPAKVRNQYMMLKQQFLTCFLSKQALETISLELSFFEDVKSKKQENAYQKMGPSQIRFDFSKGDYQKDLFQNYSRPKNASLHDKSEIDPWNFVKLLGLSKNQNVVLEAYLVALTFVSLYNSIPKALVETTLEDDTFLDLKVVEQMKLLPCLGNVLIAPLSKKSEFVNVLNSYKNCLHDKILSPFDLLGSPFCPEWLRGQGSSSSGEWKVIEQGPELCTIRFKATGQPVVEDNQQYSAVSGGHGELLRVFDEICDEFPTAEALHIRNIDNVIGCSDDREHEIYKLGDLFRRVRDIFEYLRSSIEDHLLTMSADDRNVDVVFLEALKSLDVLHIDSVWEKISQNILDYNGGFLGVSPKDVWAVCSPLFHWQGNKNLITWQSVLLALNKPLSVFGVVRKETGDVGGGPVFAKIGETSNVKICLEMPHASEEDRAIYFGSEGKCTHFNPVLVFFELVTGKRAFEVSHAESNEKNVGGSRVPFKRLFNDEFWIRSQKTYKGEKVFYHETVLYELLGNSLKTNLLFIEVPRLLFNPHKMILDSFGRNRKFYGFDEFFKK